MERSTVKTDEKKPEKRETEKEQVEKQKNHESLTMEPKAGKHVQEDCSVHWGGMVSKYD